MWASVLWTYQSKLKNGYFSSRHYLSPVTSPTLKHLPLSHGTILWNILFHSLEHNLFFQLKVPLGFPHISKYFQTKSNHKIPYKITCNGFIWHHPKVHLLLKIWIYSWAPDVSWLCSFWEEALGWVCSTEAAFPTTQVWCSCTAWSQTPFLNVFTHLGVH